METEADLTEASGVTAVAAAQAVAAEAQEAAVPVLLVVYLFRVWN
jgi:hypothetical protein